MVNLAIQSYAGAWYFQIEAVSISKDGKTGFCLRSSNLMQKPIQESEDEDGEDENNEDDEWWDDPDNLKGNLSKGR